MFIGPQASKNVTKIIHNFLSNLAQSQTGENLKTQPPSTGGANNSKKNAIS